MDRLSLVNRALFPASMTTNYGATDSGLNLVWPTTKPGKAFPCAFFRGPNPASGLASWFKKASPPSIMIYLHGNGCSVLDMESEMAVYARTFQCAVLAVEYPGYGPAQGSPGESGLVRNTRAAWKFVTEVLKYPHNNIIIMGRSIGSGAAIQQASEMCQHGTPPGLLVTQSAYTSIKDVCKNVAGRFIGSLIVNRFESIKNITHVNCPTLFIHGEQDRLIPCDHSKALFKVCPSPRKTLKLAPYSDHNLFNNQEDVYDPICVAIRDFYYPNALVDCCPLATPPQESCVAPEQRTTASTVAGSSSTFFGKSFLTTVVGISAGLVEASVGASAATVESVRGVSRTPSDGTSAQRSSAEAVVNAFFESVRRNNSVDASIAFLETDVIATVDDKPVWQGSAAARAWLNQLSQRNGAGAGAGVGVGAGDGAMIEPAGCRDGDGAYKIERIDVEMEELGDVALVSVHVVTGDDTSASRAVYVVSGGRIGLVKVVKVQ